MSNVRRQNCEFRVFVCHTNKMLHHIKLLHIYIYIYIFVLLKAYYFGTLKMENLYMYINFKDLCRNV